MNQTQSPTRPITGTPEAFGPDLFGPRADTIVAIRTTTGDGGTANHAHVLNVDGTNGVAIMGIHNIPCIGFGPGHEPQAHAPDEWTPVDHLSKASAFYAQFVEEMAV